MNMARVRVKTLGTLYYITKTLEQEVEVRDNSTVLDVVRKIAERYPRIGDEVFTGEGKFSEDYRILLNGREVSYLEGENTKIKDGDEVVIIPPVGGGL